MSVIISLFSVDFMLVFGFKTKSFIEINKTTFSINFVKSVSSAGLSYFLIQKIGMFKQTSNSMTHHFSSSLWNLKLVSYAHTNRVIIVYRKIIKNLRIMNKNSFIILNKKL